MTTTPDILVIEDDPIMREALADWLQAAGYAVRPWLIPLVELTTVTRVEGSPQPGNRDRRGQPQLYITPGVNAQLLRELTLGLGIQLPLTSARTFDYTLHGTLDWSF